MLEARDDVCIARSTILWGRSALSRTPTMGTCVYWKLTTPFFGEIRKNGDFLWGISKNGEHLARMVIFCGGIARMVNTPREW